MRRWLHPRRNITPELTNSVVAFFECAFENTRCLDRAWFGVHPSGISLVVGGIYLAGIQRSGVEQGVWLLVDQELPKIDGVEYQPVKSTQRSEQPLVWLHSVSLNPVPHLIGVTFLWESFAQASEKILRFPIASDRDTVQKRRKKIRLSELMRESVILYPDEEEESRVFREGFRKTVTVNAYERDQKARDLCIQHYGARCFVCDFSFGEAYGEFAEGFIHVHHLRPLSEIGEEYTVDPVKDLRPVCPNCHAVIHLRRPGPAFSIEEVRAALAERCSPNAYTSLRSIKRK